MTPEHPGFAAAVRVAKRALAERIAARANDGRISAAAPREHDQRDEERVTVLQQHLNLHPGAPKVAGSRLPDNPDPPENIAKPWKKPWDQ